MATVQDSPSDIVSAARAMIEASRAPRTAENLNRAMMAIAQGKETTDFDSMIEQAGNPTARPRRTGPANPRGPSEGEQTQSPVVNRVERPVADQPPAPPRTARTPAAETPTGVPGMDPAPVSGPGRISRIPQSTEDAIFSWLEANGAAPVAEGTIPANPGPPPTVAGPPAPSGTPTVPRPGSAAAGTIPSGDAGDTGTPDAAPARPRMMTGDEAVNDPALALMLPMLLGSRGPRFRGGPPDLGVTLAPRGIPPRSGPPATTESTAYRMYPEPGPTVTQGPARLSGGSGPTQLPGPGGNTPQLPPGPGAPPQVGGPGNMLRLPRFDPRDEIQRRVQELLRRRRAAGA